MNFSWDSNGVKAWLYGAGINGVAVERSGNFQTEPLIADQYFTLKVTAANGEEKVCKLKIGVEPPSNLTVLGIGQSNMQIYFQSKDPNELGFSGERYFEENLARHSPTITKADFVNAAFGGSALLKENDSSASFNNHWVDLSAAGVFSEGPRLSQALRIIRERKSQGREVNFFLWAQGEQDAAKIEARARKQATVALRNSYLNVAMQKYERALSYTISRLRLEAGSPYIPFGIQMLGQRNSIVTTHIGIHKVRQIQSKMVSKHTNVKIVANMYDASIYDTVHMDARGQRLVLDRVMQNIGRWRAASPILSGPAMSSAKIDSTRKRVIVLFNNVNSILIGDNAMKLLSIVDENYSIIAQPAEIALVNSKTIELVFNETIPQGVKLVSIMGVVSEPGQFGFIFKDNGRYIIDEFGFPLQPGELLL